MGQECLFVCALCLDTFFTACSYGISKIRIPLHSGLLISGIGAAMLLLSLLCSHWLSLWIPASWCQYGGVLILAALGGGTICRSISARTHHHTMPQQSDPPSHFLAVCLDAESADADHSKHICPKEAVLLAVALSLDSLAGGLGAGLEQLHPWRTAGVCFLIGSAAVLSGQKIGKRLTPRTPGDYSWISGCLLLLLALLRLRQVG